jgi:hypothetical protein
LLAVARRQNHLHRGIVTGLRLACVGDTSCPMGRLCVNKREAMWRWCWCHTRARCFSLLAVSSGILGPLVAVFSWVQRVARQSCSNVQCPHAVCDVSGSGVMAPSNMGLEQLTQAGPTWQLCQSARFREYGAAVFPEPYLKEVSGEYAICRDV